MKLLKISENAGHFLTENGDYSLIEKIGKDDLFRLVGYILEKDEAEMDMYNDQTIKNQSHQVIYKSIFQKLTELRKRRQEFIDESARIFIEDYERYRE